MTNTPRPVRVFVLGASLRKESFNVRLASLAARTASAHGAAVTTVDYASLAVPRSTPTCWRPTASRRARGGSGTC
jgi:hypothetical protein